MSYYQSNEPYNKIKSNDSIWNGVAFGAGIAGAGAGVYAGFFNNKTINKVEKGFDEKGFTAATEKLNSEKQSLENELLRKAEEHDNLKSRAISLRYPDVYDPLTETTNKKDIQTANKIHKHLEKEYDNIHGMMGRLEELHGQKINKSDFETEVHRQEKAKRLSRGKLGAAAAGAVAVGGLFGGIIDSNSN